MVWNNTSLIKKLKDGGVAVMPTDTIYGIVGQAQSISIVNRIYNIKKRRPDKPFIILINDIDKLEKFSISLSKEQKNKLKDYWPGPVSIILECLDDSFEYLHRGTKALAFRMPSPELLRRFLLETGPLIAPSANLEGIPPAENILQAKKYFGDSIDFYADGGILSGKASKIIKLHKDGSETILRG